jgi:hypothetical protein
VQVHFASRFDLLANSIWETTEPTLPAPGKRQHPRVGTQLASSKTAPRWGCYDFLVSHCSNHRHPGSPYLVLRAFRPATLVIPRFLPPDLLDFCSNGAVNLAPKAFEANRFGSEGDYFARPKPTGSSTLRHGFLLYIRPAPLRFQQISNFGQQFFLCRRALRRRRFTETIHLLNHNKQDQRNYQELNYRVQK